MNAKKLMISMTVMSLILVACVVLIVHNSKGSEPASIEIEKDSEFIGEWYTPDVKDDASMDYMDIKLHKDGEVTGKVGGYDFEGSWEPTSDTHANILNPKGDIAYEGNIKGRNLKISGKAVTDSSSWTLQKK